MAKRPVTCMDDKPIKVTDADFDKVIKEKPLVIVDFWAEWCVPCRAIAPIVEDLAKKYAGKVTLAKLNTHQNPEGPPPDMATGPPPLPFFQRRELPPPTPPAPPPPPPPPRA